MDVRTELVAGLLNDVTYPARADLLTHICSEHMPPVSEWPLGVLRRFLGKHVGFGDRCYLVYQLLANHMDPTLLAHWCLIEPGYLRDYPARKHMAGLIKEFAAGKFCVNTARCFYDKTEIFCKPPLFATDKHLTRYAVWDVVFGPAHRPFDDEERYWTHPDYTDAHGRKRGEAGFVDHDATDHAYVMKGHEIMPAGESFFREAVKLLDPRFVY